MTRLLFGVLFYILVVDTAKCTAQETFSYNFTNATHNIFHTANVSPDDIVRLVNIGIPANYNIRFSQDGLFSTDDPLNSNDYQAYFETGSHQNVSVSEMADQISGNEFFCRVYRTNGILLLTVKVLFDYANIPEDNVEFSLHPNPCSDYVLIPAYVNELQLFDSSGKLLIQREVRSKNYLLDIRYLQRGRYFLLIDGNVHDLLVE